jgi:hypothetical protein
MSAEWLRTEPGLNHTAQFCYCCNALARSDVKNLCNSVCLTDCEWRVSVRRFDALSRVSAKYEFLVSSHSRTVSLGINILLFIVR